MARKSLILLWEGLQDTVAGWCGKVARKSLILLRVGLCAGVCIYKYIWAGPSSPPPDY